MAATSDHDGLTNGCSTIGISKSPPVEVMEQAYPVLYRHYALREGSGGAGRHRGGFGLAYEVELLRGEARASFVMDHGRFGPQGALGGDDGVVNSVVVYRNGKAHVPRHLSKEQDIPLQAGDRVEVGTPGGGGYGNAFDRDPALVLRTWRSATIPPSRHEKDLAWSLRRMARRSIKRRRLILRSDPLAKRRRARLHAIFARSLMNADTSFAERGASVSWVTNRALGINSSTALRPSAVKLTSNRRLSPSCFESEPGRAT